jgi:NADPH:quinone reductase-like Zn-dependent oxidoreductase
MKAVRLLEYGGQLVFSDVATPTMARDEILVKVKSTAVNQSWRGVCLSAQA